LVEHFIKFGSLLVKKFIKQKKDLFIDIGGNDGVLLNSIKRKCHVINVEPAKNIAKMSENKGVETICEFFSEDLAKRIVKKYGSARVVTASNIFAHVDNIDDFLRGIEVLIGDEGVFIFEAHWVANLLGLAGIGGFDQIYHEHLSYFSLLSAEKLINRFNLKIFDAQIVPTHGKLLRVYVSKNRKPSSSLKNIFSKEKKLKLNSIKTYLDFAKNAKNNCAKLTDLLLELKRQNKKIVGYGAPGKSTTLLNYCGIDNTILDYITDNSLEKIGRYIPGVNIPIVSYSQKRFLKDSPDYILLLAWNYADDILKKEGLLRDRGIKFVIPVPKIKIV